MESGIFQIWAFVIIIILIWRVTVIIKLDKLRKGERSSVFFKYMLGAYGIEALLPVVTSGNTKEESDLIWLANILFAVFYILAIGFFITIWVLYA